MEENKEKYEGDIKVKTPFLKKLENFWYHYKWHSIVSAVVVIAIVICSLQMCTKTTYDIHILYAGYYEIEMSGSGGDVSAHSKMTGELRRVTEDFDKDGNVNVNLLNLFVIDKNERDMLLSENSDFEINEMLVKEDTDTLRSNLLFGEYYICLLSERLFLEYEKMYDGELFAPISDYTAEGIEYEYASENGIYLRSLDFCTLPEMSKLPDDTVIAIRALSEVSTAWGKKNNEESFAKAEAVLRNILFYNE